jgi:hypothetical protein
MPTFPIDDAARISGFVLFQRFDENDASVGTPIVLPVPNNLMYADRASYENADIGVVAATMKDNAEGDGPLAKARSVLSNLSVGDGKGLALDVTSRILGNRTRFLSGRTPNPNTRALFKQMNLREFAFNYKLLPVSREESNEIKAIIKEFRTGMHPNTTDSVTIGDGQSVNATYIMPDRFDIQIYLSGGIVEPRIQPAYLSTFTLSYNNSQNSLVNDGGKPEFSEVDIAMTFTEHMAQTRHNIEKGF